MKTSTRLLNSILILALSCLFQFAHAQIVYTDVNPDIKIKADDVYNLDLDNDGLSDFDINVSANTSTYTCFFGSCSGKTTQGTHKEVAVTPLGSNMVQMLVPALIENSLIDSSLEWTNEKQVMAEVSIHPGCWYSSCAPIEAHTGPWYGSPPGNYLALKLRTGNKIYYGWVKLKVTDAGSAKIEEYGYMSISKGSVLAGQTCPPQATISPAGTISLCNGDSAILSSMNSGTDLSYQWKKDGTNIYGATNKSYTATTGGKYKVKVTDNANACTSTSTVVKVKVPCKMIDESLKLEAATLSVYPNPFSRTATISFTLLNSENISLKIFNVEGRIIRTLVNDNMSAGEHTLTWDALDENGNELSDGIYFLRMKTAGELKTISLSVVK